jgi:hypothetical protein
MEITPMNRFACKTLSLIAVLAFAPLAWAGSPVTITYGPLASSIPALSGWMLGIMGVLLALLAYRGLRNRRVDNKLASLVGLAIAGATLATTADFTKEAQATGCSDPNMCSLNGGTINVGCGTSTVHNMSAQAQEIKVIRVYPPNESSPAPTYSGTCQEHAVVPVNGSCSITVVCEPA